MGTISHTGMARVATCFAAVVIGLVGAAEYDVRRYGAVGDGKHDDTPAFEVAPHPPWPKIRKLSLPLFLTPAPALCTAFRAVTRRVGKQWQPQTYGGRERGESRISSYCTLFPEKLATAIASPLQRYRPARPTRYPSTAGRGRCGRVRRRRHRAGPPGHFPDPAD